MSKPAKISLRRGARPARGIYLRSSGSQIPEESKEDGRVTLTMLNEGEKLQIFCSGEWRTTDLPAEPGAHLFVNLPEDWPQNGCGLGCCNRSTGTTVDLGPRYSFDRIMGEGGMGLVVKSP